MTYLITTVLLQILEELRSVDQPENGRIEVLNPLFDQFADRADGTSQESFDFNVAVDVIGVSDAHENDVSRKTRKK